MKFIEFAMSHARIWVMMVVMGFIVAVGSIAIFETSGITTALVIGSGMIALGGMMIVLVIATTLRLFGKAKNLN